jgi:hypothetical protein
VGSDEVAASQALDRAVSVGADPDDVDVLLGAMAGIEPRIKPIRIKRTIRRVRR